jgi:hypothetical protein
MNTPIAKLIIGLLLIGYGILKLSVLNNGPLSNIFGFIFIVLGAIRIYLGYMEYNSNSGES